MLRCEFPEIVRMAFFQKTNNNLLSPERFILKSPMHIYGGPKIMENRAGIASKLNLSSTDKRFAGGMEIRFANSGN